MASCKVEELESEPKHLALTCEQLSLSSPNDIMEDHQSDTNTFPKPQTPGKLRRTALRFFGVRKSICLLPALFGGRIKNQNKCVKKGVGKSKTLDGLSKAICDDSLGSEDTFTENLVHLSQKEAAQKNHNGSRSEYSYPAAEQKSLSLPRQKRGLRGLFHSIRLHRTQRNAEVENNEMMPLSTSLFLKEVPDVQDDANKNECLGGSSPPDVPDCVNITSDVTPECNDVDAMPSADSFVKQGSLKSLFADQIPENENEMTAEVSREYHNCSIIHSESCPQLQMTPEPETICQQLPTGSSDQLNLNFEDVESLKSFDSLTGCGDIIADQDDDSIAESTVSGERSRIAGKRSSCCLTYQGGGEEMASPDDLEADGLRDLWADQAEEDIFCSGNEDLTPDLTSPHRVDFVTSQCAQQASKTDTSTLTPDALTPQSEHQESVPNSDEGYYDSTTPGPDEGLEKLDRIRQEDRLPRDSYSGDALYELFAPDDSLISPRYENRSKLPDSESCGYIVGSEDLADSAFAPEINPLQMGSRLYEDPDFPSVFEAGLCNKSTESAPFTKSIPGKGSKENANLNSKAQAFFNYNRINLEASHENGNILDPKEKRITTNNMFEGVSDHNFKSFSQTFCEAKEDSEGKKSLYDKSCSSTHNHVDDGQTVCFSQALVDYTKHSRFLRNSYDNMDGLDANSSFAPNMQALPTIVTFDVMDMHNEGEYEDQIHVEMEDVSSPYEDFQESYLQKEAFAECDYQMYEHNLFSNALAIASLPRHLGLTKGNPSMSGPLTLDRRSRSLDREGLEFSISERYHGSGAAYPQSEKDCHDKKNVHVSAFEVAEGCNSFKSLPWPAKPFDHSPTEVNSEKGPTLCHVQVKQTFSSNTEYPGSTSLQLPSSVSEREACDCISQNTELCNRQSGFPYSAVGFSEIVETNLIKMVSTSDDADGQTFYEPVFNLQSCSQFGKNTHTTGGQGRPRSGRQLNTDAAMGEKEFLSPEALGYNMSRSLHQTP